MRTLVVLGLAFALGCALLGCGSASTGQASQADTAACDSSAVACLQGCGLAPAQAQGLVDACLAGDASDFASLTGAPACSATPCVTACFSTLTSCRSGMTEQALPPDAGRCVPPYAASGCYEVTVGDQNPCNLSPVDGGLVCCCP